MGKLFNGDTSSPNILVVHCKTPVRPGFVRFYVGRPSPLGNPFLTKPKGQYTRGAAIHEYRLWLGWRLDLGLFHHRMGREETPEFIEYYKIIKAAWEHNNVELACWCAPKDCHADVIRELADDEISLARELGTTSAPKMNHERKTRFVGKVGA